MIDFQNKKITVMGLGLLGRGIGVVKYLVSKGARVTVTDLKNAQALEASVDEINKFYRKFQISNSKSQNQNLKSQIPNPKFQISPKIYKPRFVLGGHRMSDFKNADMVFKAAGVPLDSPYISAAKKSGVPIFMDDALFAYEAPCQIIGITGTRGKTTTSTLVAEITKATGKKVYLAGNIPGTATLPLLDKVKKDDLVVLELSSWQLQGWRDLKISPNIAVVTNIYADHMNYYKNDMKKYVYDKEAIFENQGKDDFLVLNKNCPWCQKFAKKAKGKVVWFSKKDVPAKWKLKILGEHNLENIAAAMAVGKIFGLNEARIKEVVENFSGVPGRTEFVAEIGGVKYYNDTTATMPEATIAALEAFAPLATKKLKNQKTEKHVILIAGGADKNLEFSDLAKAIKKYTKAVVLLNGTATPKLNYKLQITNYKFPVIIANSMKEAVKEARQLAQRGDIVLLSPAAASFGMFKNEFDRGEQFLKEVKR
jgi:UDP-N-acetylmuramoylalanine--D-glutamate ligase